MTETSDVDPELRKGLEVVLPVVHREAMADAERRTVEARARRIEAERRAAEARDRRVEAERLRDEAEGLLRDALALSNMEIRSPEDLRSFAAEGARIARRLSDTRAGRQKARDGATGDRPEPTDDADASDPAEARG